MVLRDLLVGGVGQAALTAALAAAVAEIDATVAAADATQTQAEEALASRQVLQTSRQVPYDSVKLEQHPKQLRVSLQHSMAASRHFRPQVRPQRPSETNSLATAAF